MRKFVHMIFGKYPKIVRIGYFRDRIKFFYTVQIARYFIFSILLIKNIPKNYFGHMWDNFLPMKQKSILPGFLDVHIVLFVWYEKKDFGSLFSLEVQKNKYMSGIKNFVYPYKQEFYFFEKKHFSFF